MVKDIFPIFVSTSIFLLVIYFLDFNFEISRFWIFASLIGLGMLLLIVNILASSEGRKIVLKYLKRKL